MIAPDTVKPPLPGRVLLIWILGASIAATFAFWALWPNEYVLDDGGIVLRYLDNFSQGGLFKYNLQDPPIYGLSGFLHGCLAGALASSQVLSPTNAATASNALGVALTLTAMLLILNCYTRSKALLLVAWIFVVAASNYFVRTAFQALETPLHLGIVLLCAWALLAQQRRTFWLLCALSIASKLDATVVVAVFASSRFFQLWRSQHRIAAMRAETKIALVFAGVPLVLWLMATISIFGGPMPQSAYAKLHLHGHLESRLAFFAKWWENDSLRILGYAAPVLLAGALPTRHRIHFARSGPATLLMASAALVALYCYYNPQERMAWYYVLPQTLLVTGGASALLGLLESYQRTARTPLRVFAILVLALATLFEAPRNLRHARATIHYILQTEPERKAVGQFVKSHSAPSDRLYTGWGHIARDSGRYVYVSSGLNSRVVTQLKLQDKNPLFELKPDWVVQQRLLRPPRAQTRLGFQLVASFYGISHHGRPAWRVYSRVVAGDPPAVVYRAVATDEISSDGKVWMVRDHMLHARVREEVSFEYAGGATLRELRFGIARAAKEIVLSVEVQNDGAPTSVLPVSVAAVDHQDLVFGETQEVAISVDDAYTRKITLRVDREVLTSDSPPVRILEPTWGTDPNLE